MIAEDVAASVTTADHSISTAELERLLVPLSRADLLVEAAGWQEIVKAKAQEIARIEVVILRENDGIEISEEIQRKEEQARAQLEAAADKISEAQNTGDLQKIAEAQEAVTNALQRIEEVELAANEIVKAGKKTAEMKRKIITGGEHQSIGVVAAAEKVLDVAAQTRQVLADAEQIATKVNRMPVDAQALSEEAAELNKAATAVAEVEEAAQAAKLGLLGQVTRLRQERTMLLDNLRAVIDELESKTDNNDTETLSTVKDYRRYIKAVAGIHVDVTDRASVWMSFVGWVTSQEGGIRWLKNVVTFIAILVFAWFLAKLLSRLTLKTMSRVNLPSLIKDFSVKGVRWLVMIFGIISALAALEVSVGPLVALIGAAGFILAFAMQDSLSNFASGLMILLFRPFDIGDAVEAGGVSGTVRSMNLVSTTIRTFDNKMMVVPNSKIWSDVITNITGVTRRRVDMEFGIGYSDDMDKAQAILEEIVNSHPKVLDDPAPVVKLSALADSSVNFICRPWTSPDDYWDVYWDVTRTVKQRFDAAGIGIPFPQRDVHLYLENGSDAGLRNAIG
ncbi:MAG: mechanosensitive ion channel domain-containing protein [Gammaproteobacteria bacterium]